MTGLRGKLIYLLFFLSGFSALIYEVVWARKLSLIFGTDAYGIATVIVVFFMGLALGSWIFSRINVKITSMRLYGLMELGIGVYAISTPWIFKLIENAQGYFWRTFKPTFGQFNLITFVLAVVGLILPTILMGGTFPAVVKATKMEFSGFLYGINTLGAVMGTAIAGFVFIATFGVNETIFIAAVISVLVGVVALYLARKPVFQTPLQTSLEVGANESKENKRYTRWILVSFIVAGFSSIGLEVLWTRTLINVIGGSTYAFSLVLLSFLIGISLGSIVLTKFSDLLVNTLLYFAVVEILVGLFVLISIPLLGNFPFYFLSIYKLFGSSFLNLYFGLWLLSLLVMFLPTFFMGVAFPLVIKQIPNPGKVYAVNTMGGVFGALVAGFVIIPILGVQKGILTLGTLFLLIGIFIIFLSEARKSLKYPILIVIFVAILIGTRLKPWNKIIVSAGFYTDPASYLKQDRATLERILKGGETLYEAEGVSANVTVSKDKSGILSLRINGKADASTGSDMENQLLLGHLPLFLHKNTKDVLVVGMGSGITLGSVLSHDVARVDAVEIEPKVIQASRFFNDYADDALDDRRVKLIIGDGRNYLLATSKKYDVITSEPSNPWLSGSSKLFTKEYFELLKKAVKDDGVVLQWINLYAIDVDGLKSVLAAFNEVFPEISVFAIPASNDLAMIGSKQKVDFDLSSLSEEINREKVKKNLSKVAISEPFEILSYFALDKRVVEKITKDSMPNTDNNPYLEFSAPKNLYSTQKINPWRVIYQNLSPLEGKADKFRRARMLTHINLIEGNVGEGIKAGEEALGLDPDNPFLKEELAKLYFSEGTSYFNSQDYLKASASYEKSVTQKPTSEAYFNLGQSYEDSDQTKAEEAYKKASGLDPDLIEAYRRLGDIHIDQGNLNSAIDSYNSLIEKDPKDVPALVTLGNLYFLRKDFGKAKEYAEKALKIDPNYAEAKELLQKLP